MIALRRQGRYTVRPDAAHPALAWMRGMPRRPSALFLA